MRMFFKLDELYSPMSNQSLFITYGYEYNNVKVGSGVSISDSAKNAGTGQLCNTARNYL